LLFYLGKEERIAKVIFKSIPSHFVQNKALFEFQAGCLKKRSNAVLRKMEQEKIN